MKYSVPLHTLQNPKPSKNGTDLYEGRGTQNIPNEVGFKDQMLTRYRG